MNLITPLLFVFYLQVVPPPPTMYGGEDFQAGYTVFDTDLNRRNFAESTNFFGFILDFLTNNWSSGELLQALSGSAPLPGGWVGYENIFGAIQNDFLNRLTNADWNTLIDFAAGNGKDVNASCDLATDKGSSVGSTNPNCIETVPLPKELLFSILFSFLTIYYFQGLAKF